MPVSALLHGQIHAAYGRQFLVALDVDDPPHTKTLTVSTRARAHDYVVGDRVAVRRLNAEQGVIEALLPRRSILYRADGQKEKRIAANVDQLALVLAPKPDWHEELGNRCLLAAEAAGVGIVLVLNKTDLAHDAPAAYQALRARLAAYQALGYPLLETSARHGQTDALRALLRGKTTVLVGQSGVGKSSLLNALVPVAQRETQALSAAGETGRHTTTHAALYGLSPLPALSWTASVAESAVAGHAAAGRVEKKPMPDDAGAIIDSPGMQTFGLSHLTRSALHHAFPELRAAFGAEGLPPCRFRDCRHDREPGCALHPLQESGHMLPLRAALLRDLLCALRVSPGRIAAR